MKKLLFAFIAIIILAFAFALGAFIWWRGATSSFNVTSKDPVSVVIAKGSSADRIASELYKKGLIKSELAFRIYVRVNGETQIPPGEFQIAPGLSIPDVISQLKKGPTLVWVTVQEGLRREEVVEKFITGLSLIGEKAAAFREEFLDSSKGEEGYLFPDTYLIPKTITGAKSVTLLKDTFMKKFGNSYRGTRSLEDVVILASLVERESKGKGDRPVIAGILLNRLEIGMKLQVDATIQYALGTKSCGNKSVCSDWWPTVYRADYELALPYSTYYITGLPPGPIANPGLASLNAAAQPAESNYIFYIHEENGTPHYAETLDMHNQNIARYLN